jgi:DCN1-like protein 4/5
MENEFLQLSEQSNEIGPQGLVHLAGKLGIDPEDIVIYILAWKLNCQKPLTITKAEWTAGMAAMRITSLSKLQSQIPTLRREIADPKSFKAFYTYIFTWCVERQGGKFLPAETACYVWKIVFGGRSFPHLSEWLNFVGGQSKNITRDSWNMTLDFSSTNVENYDENGSWPTLMDDFVQWWKTQKK